MLLLLCIMLDSDPGLQVFRRITSSLDQRINAKFAKSVSVSACLPTGRKRRQSLSPRTRAWPCVSLVITDDS